MSSVKSTFNYDDFDYEPTVDSSFLDILFQLILKGNLSKVKEFFLLIEEVNEGIEDGGDGWGHSLNSAFMADDYNVEDYYEGDEYNGSHGSFKSNKINDIIFSNEYTPLILASQLGLSEFVEFFLSLSFDVNKSIRKTGLTALLAGCCSVPNDSDDKLHFENVTKCIKLLIDAGANVTDCLLKSQQTALHLIASVNNVTACKLLVGLVDVNCENSKNCTPIMIAASKGHLEIVEVLLKNGAKLSMRNSSGLSAVELAMIKNHQNVVDLLIQPTDNLDFYAAWAVVHKNIDETEKVQNVEDCFMKKFYSSKYFSDPVASLCASLNLTHLQPILEKHRVTFNQLRVMSDTDMKNIGIFKFSDRKCLLNLMQEVHRVSWNHQTSIYTPNYKSSISPIDLLDVVKNAEEHLEFLESTIIYIGNHLKTNPDYYLNFSQNKSFFEKCVEHCKFAAYRASNLQENLVKIDSIIDKMHQCALEEDLSCQLDAESEKIKLKKMTKRFSSPIKTGIILSGISIVTLVFLRSRFAHV